MALATIGLAGEAFPPFAAEGILSTERVVPGGANVIHTADFKVVVSNGWWEIEVLYKSPAEIAGDGVDCRKVSDGVRSFPILAESKRILLTNQAALSGAVALPTEIPTANEGVLACWLSLCPNPKLPIIDAKRMRRFLPFPEYATHPKNEGTYSIKHLLPEAAFVQTLTITNNGFVFQPGQDPVRFPAPLDKGFTELDYRLTEITNVAGHSFPLESVVQYFAPLSTRLEDVKPMVIDRIRVQKIALGAGALEIAQTLRRPERLLASDRRPPGLREGVVVSHIVTNDQWVPTTNKALAELAAVYKQSAAKKRDSKGIVLLALFGIVALVPFARAVLHKQKTVDQKQVL